MAKKVRFLRSLNFALQGIKYCLLKERNIRIHMVFAFLAILLSWFFDISNVEWALIFLAITLVIALEMINTAVERTVDIYTAEYHPLAEIAKNAAAGAVLIAALNALIVGAVIFLPKIFIYFR